MTEIPTAEFLCFGTEELVPKPIALQAGPMTALFEPHTGFLRYIRWRSVEVVRGVYAAVRDRNWGTVPSTLSHCQINSNAYSFHLRFDVECRQSDIDFFWRGEITGNSEGDLRFVFQGQARTDFLKNRIGFCLLHPSECAGQACEVTRWDGTLVRGTFPVTISPHQPFMNIQGFRHWPVKGLKTEVRFVGDTFEMEDQRNWTDASFKTYCTPLEEPFPVQIRQGESVHQEIHLHMSEEAAQEEDSNAKAVVATEKSDRIILEPHPSAHAGRPCLGFCLDPHGQVLTEQQKERIAGLKPDHFRTDLHFRDPGWLAVWKKAVETVRVLDVNVALHVALHLSSDPDRELDEFFLNAAESGWPDIAFLLVFDEGRKATSIETIRNVQLKLDWWERIIPLAAGTNAFFAELNRNRLPTDIEASPCYSINPQVHAFDNLSLAESLLAQPDTVDSCLQFSGKAPLVSPITLRPRFNPNATEDPPVPPPGSLPPEVDPRQMTLFGAAWTLGSLAALGSHKNPLSLTYYELTGWRGLMVQPQGAPLPHRFPSPPGGVFPVYHVFADCAGLVACQKVVHPRPLEIAAWAGQTSDGTNQLQVANLTDHKLSVEWPEAAKMGRVRVMDESNVWQAMTQPESWRENAIQEMGSSKGRFILELPRVSYACLQCG